MIELEVPKDIRRYEAKLFGPFTTRQLICFVIASVIAFGVYMLISSVIPTDVCFFLIIIIDAPVLLCGWFKPYGMPFEKFIKTAFATTVLSPSARKYVTENKYFNKYKADLAKAAAQKKKKKSSNQSKPSKNKELVAYK